MDYKTFYEAITQNETARVKAAYFPASCAVERIPEVFTLTFPSIIEVINNNLGLLCKSEDQIIALYGLQPASGAICSDFSIKYNRIIDPTKPELHFCCTLDYLLVQASELNKLATWKGGKSLAVNFTTGEIMNAGYFLHRLGLLPTPTGVLYGNIDQKILAKVWQQLKEFQYVRH
jgi:hypothetical protein